MTNSYTFNTSELNYFLEYLIYEKDLGIDEMKAVIEAAENWEINCHGLSYFIGRIIQKKINKNELNDEYLDNVYSLVDKVFFSINEFDSEFVNYMLSHDRLIESEYTLEEILILLNTYYIERNYDRTIYS